MIGAPFCENHKIGTLQNVWEEKSLIEGFLNLDWKRLLKLSKEDVLGLDIGSSAVKIVQLRKDAAGCVVTAAGEVAVADKAGANKIDGEMNTVRAVTKCLQAMGIQTQLAVCGVCGPEVAVRCFKFPALPQEEVPGAVLLEAEQVCPFNIGDAAVDYQLIPNGDDSISGVLVAATNELIKRKTQLVKNASLNSVLMDVDGLALLNCFSECEKPETHHTTAILNVGSSYTTLAIMGNNDLPFIRDIAYAGNNIVEQIATEKNIATETVNKILSGDEDSSQAELELTGSLEKACQKLIVDVTETLRYYTAQEKSAYVEKIYVCGGFALVKGFVELLDNRLPAVVVLWNPFDKISSDNGAHSQDILKKNGPAMVVAAGLAMRLF